MAGRKSKNLKGTLKFRVCWDVVDTDNGQIVRRVWDDPAKARDFADECNQEIGRYVDRFKVRRRKVPQGGV